MSRVLDMLRLALAAIGVAILLIGMPMLLWTVAQQTLTFPSSVDWFHLDQNVQAPPFSRQFSDWADRTYHALRLSLGADGLVLVLMLAIGAAAWVGLVWLTLVELVLLARDGTMLLVERARLAGPRGWIASLLAILALSASANTASAATAAPTTAATAPPQPGTPENTGCEDTTACEATTRGGYTDPPPTTPTTHLPDELRPDCPRYRVHAGDTLTRIAARHLGDPARWRELAELNQPWLANPNQLIPGWQLLLPPDTPSPGQPEITEITVARGDTLASLAETHLNAPERAGELYDLNVGRTQPDGLQLADPNILLPGWKLLVPLDPATPPMDAKPAPSPSGAVEPSAPPAADSASSTDPQQNPEAAGAVSTTSTSAIILAGGGLLALGVASAVAAAMRRQRHARDRSYRPGSGDRSQPPVPGPAVYALRLAADQHTDDAPDTASDPPQGLGSGELEIGVREDYTHAIDLAALHGLGLTGPGAEASVRALLVQLLATTHATVITPEQDALALLGTELPISPRLQLASDEHEAAQKLARRTESHPVFDDTSDQQQVHTVIVAEARRAPDELHTLLAHDTPGVAGLLLGSWPTGVSLRVRDDGLVTGTDPTLDDLRGTRLFSLNTTDTRELLTLLAEGPNRSGENCDEADSTDESETTELIPATNTVNAAEHDAESDLALGAEPGPASTRPLAPDNSPDETPQTDSTDPDPAHHRAVFVLSILGPVTLTTSGDQQDLAALLAPKHRALLVFLALHPRGTTRAAVREALWPDAGGSRPYNAFYAALSQLRKTLNPQLDRDDNTSLIVQRHEQLALNPELVDVDYWHLLDDEDALHRASTHEHRTTAWKRIATYPHGELADGLSELWLDAPREHARRTILDALSGLAAHHRDHDDPERQLQLLERARRISPENEALHRDILRAHATLGQPDAINRSLDLLATNLADIGERPEPSTLALARALQAQQHHVAR